MSNDLGHNNPPHTILELDEVDARYLLATLKNNRKLIHKSWKAIQQAPSKLLDEKGLNRALITMALSGDLGQLDHLVSLMDSTDQGIYSLNIEEDEPTLESLNKDLLFLKEKIINE